MKQKSIEKLESRIQLAAIEFSTASEHIGNIERATQVLVADMDGDNDLDIVTPNEWFENERQQPNSAIGRSFFLKSTVGTRVFAMG